MSEASLSGESAQALEVGDSGQNSYPSSALSTASLRESIYNYQREHGRTYHAFRRGKYCFPNDDPELERMDIHYHSLRLVLKERHWLCPIEFPTSVLDVGAGTGIWAMDVADDYPDAQVPPNLAFQVMDADEDWDFNERFDLIHTRGMNGYCLQSWPHFYEQAFAHMKPGGWVENQEFDLLFCSDDNTVSENGALRRWSTLWNQGIQVMGRTARCYPEEMRYQMQNAGFINVQIRMYKLPIAPWPKDLRLRDAGRYFLTGFLEGISGMSKKVFLQGLEFKEEELEVLLMEVRHEARLKSVHAYLPVYIIYGQKPPTSR